MSNAKSEIRRVRHENSELQETLSKKDPGISTKTVVDNNQMISDHELTLDDLALGGNKEWFADRASIIAKLNALQVKVNLKDGTKKLERKLKKILRV